MTVPVKPLSKLFNRVFRDHPAHLSEELIYLIEMVGSSYQDKWMAEIKTDDDMWNAIRHYVERGANINAHGDIGESALTLLCQKNRFPGVAAKMIAEGADVNAASGYMSFTPLIYAALEANAELMKVLLDANANVNAATTGGNDRNVMSFLIGNAEYKCRNNPQEGRDCLKMLLDHGATLSNEDKKDIFTSAKSLAPMVPEVQDALDLTAAADKGDPAALKAVLDRGGHPDAAAAFGGETALQKVIAGQGDASMVENLLKAGADRNLRSPTTGRTPLQEAAVAGNRAAFGQLLGAGADIATSSITFDAKPMDLVEMAGCCKDAGMAQFVKETLAAHANGDYATSIDHNVAVHHSLHLKLKPKPAMAG